MDVKNTIHLIVAFLPLELLSLQILEKNYAILLYTFQYLNVSYSWYHCKANKLEFSLKQLIVTDHI